MNKKYFNGFSKNGSVEKILLKRKDDKKKQLSCSAFFMADIRKISFSSL